MEYIVVGSESDVYSVGVGHEIGWPWAIIVTQEVAWRALKKYGKSTYVQINAILQNWDPISGLKTRFPLVGAELETKLMTPHCPKHCLR